MLYLLSTCIYWFLEICLYAYYILVSLRSLTVYSKQKYVIIKNIFKNLSNNNIFLNFLHILWRLLFVFNANFWNMTVTQDVELKHLRTYDYSNNNTGCEEHNKVLGSVLCVCLYYFIQKVTLGYDTNNTCLNTG